MQQASQDKATYIEVPLQTESHQTARSPNAASNFTPKFKNSRDEKSPHFKSKIERSNIISRLNFFYILSVVAKCWKAARGGPVLHDKDLVTFPYKDRGEVMEEKFLKHLQNQKKSNPNKRPSTALAVAMTIKWTFLKAVVIQILFGFMRVFAGWVIKRLIDCYMDPDLAQTHAYWWAAILAGILVFSFYFEHHWYHMINYLCASLRSGLISMLYSKITRLSVDSITKISAGKLVNLAANDVNVFEMYGPYFPSVISGWFILIAAAALLWIYFGVTCLLGIGYLLALTPIQAAIAMLSVKPRVEKNGVTDERVRRTSEAIEGIRLLKMYTWELKFKDMIDNLRKRDVKLMKKVLYLGDVVSRSLSWSSQYIAGFLMFMLYHVTGGELTVSKVFSAYFVLSFTRFYFSYFMANGFNFAAETRLLFKRFDEIMDTSEMDGKLFDEPVDSENSIEFDKFTAYWSTSEETKPALIDLNLKIKKGSVNAVVGPVGASKTSFLLSFTGEMPKTTGSLRYKGRIAYVEQEPTIFAGTFRESILFGREYNEEYYNKVIKACNLENDLKMFPQGDMSAIGDRGNNLSGGQKARLALARAVYSDADIYLLDDPISAVDAKVAKSIFNETILGLLKEKTVILVTHQVHFVRDNENIIVMEGGRIAENGTYEQLEARGIDVNKIFSAGNTQEEQEEEEIKPKPAQQSNVVSVNNQGATAGVQAEVLTNKLKENNAIKGNVEENHANDLTTDAPISVSTNDDPYAGKVNLETYFLLFKEVGYGLMFLIFISYVLVQFGEVAFGRTLGAWVSGEFNLGESLGVVGALSLYMLVMHYIKDSAYTFGFLGASRRYHKRMIAKILRSPVGFFDANPVGRILNRFSNDIGVLDKFVPHVALDVFDVIALVLCVFITLAILDPALLGPIAFSVIVVGTLIKVYYPSIKQTKQYELSTKGPVFNLLSSSISGIVIIRTFGQGDYFKHKFTSSLYKFTKGNINFILCSRSLGFWIDLFYYITAISMFYIITARIDTSEGNSAGVLAAFTLVLVMSLTGIFQHGVRQLCQTNVLMASAARVQAYCGLPEEAPVGVPKDKEYKDLGWPRKADIEFNKVYMKYKPDGHFVIKDLNLIANSGQKIGCVGRTGAGKSTIINLLFRLQEVFKGEESSNGYITIDDINTETMGLHLLRGNISIIPQIPFIFTGTVRQNIDPLNEFTDQQIWDVLQEVRLKEHVSKLAKQLDTNMTNASAVFSVGQKQLVCLARTILKPRKVLVLDEATANMDTETDNFIQQKVMEKFKDSTVFTIAHRLATIANYDKVLVLDKGQKIEYDAPYKLLVKNLGDASLTNPTGHFGSMVTNTGPHASQRIVNIAKKAYEKKTKKESYVEMHI